MSIEIRRALPDDTRLGRIWPDRWMWQVPNRYGWTITRKGAIRGARRHLRQVARSKRSEETVT